MDSIIMQTSMLRVFDLIRILQHGKCTVKSLADRFEVAPKTIYRYLSLLEFLEVPVEKDFANRYFIAQDTCVLCGKEVHHG
jgi:predicted DNA-binding transcriptional regulator YafY